MTVAAVVRVAPVPDIVPAALVGAVEPVVDQTGKRTGWRLVAPAMLLAGPQGRDVVARFHEWRDTFERVWPLGSRAKLEQFQRLAIGLAVSEGTSFAILDRLDPRDCDVPPDAVGDLADDVRRARELLAGAATPGYAVIDVATGRTARSDVAITSEVPVAGDGGDGVVVRAGTGYVAVSGGAELPIAEFRLEGVGVAVTTPDGARHHLDGQVATLVAALAPGVAHGRTLQLPLVAVFANAIVGLAEAAAAALSRGGSLRLVERDDLV